ncbi:DUF6384 family protein [Devosia rhizoryzae]|uniref:Anti-sigma factor n=1 Tax=Devosia rhizoryzae TaxID=2774137 RepID=A0ABX7C787_9HYPH|nr:DUF6384 family protein [Devosia rhizoryzae]QQR38592.1 hypothetical protein JI748_12535 [Devosia rhizoryzae]
MSTVTAKSAAPLDEVMLAMDVVDTLRHRQDLVTRELDGAAREKQLIERLRSVYHQQGIEVPDHILKEGVAALAEARFSYDPPAPGFGKTLARLYVSRKQWGVPFLAIAGMLLVIGFGFFGVWQPLARGQAEQARIELSEGLPAQIDALYQTIFEETKVQQAVAQADALVERGKAFAAEGNRSGAEGIVAQLTELRDLLRQQYTLRVVGDLNGLSGFWRTPANNTDATNFYLVVEALDSNGNPVKLPVLNEETNRTDTVSTWGVRVPPEVYDSVAADKRDDGIIQANVVARKSDGFLEPEYLMPVSGGAVTEWENP